MGKISFLYKKFLFNFKPRKNLDITDLKMDDLDDLFNYFGSDKGSRVINPYEKKSKELLGHGFAKFYKQHLEKFRKRKINFLSSPFSIKSFNLLKKLGLKIIKIPSGEITNLPYLRHIGKMGKPIIMSTGMSTMEEILIALNILPFQEYKDSLARG